MKTLDTVHSSGKVLFVSHFHLTKTTHHVRVNTA